MQPVVIQYTEHNKHIFHNSHYLSHIYAKYTGLEKKPLSSTVTLSKSYKYLLKKRIKYDWTNKELFLPCQYYRRSKKTEFYRIDHLQICHKHHKYFFPTGSRISKYWIWQNSVFLWDTLYYFKLKFNVLNKLSIQRSLDCRQPIFSWGQKLLFWEVSWEARSHNVGVFIAHVTLSCAPTYDLKQTSSSFSKLYKIPSPSRQFSQQKLGGEARKNSHGWFTCCELMSSGKGGVWRRQRQSLITNNRWGRPVCVWPKLESWNII